MKNIEIYTFIESFLLVSILILGIVAYLKSNKKITNNALVFVFGFFLIHLFYNLTVITGVIKEYPILVLLDEIDGYFFALAIVHHISDVTKVKVNFKIINYFVLISILVSVYYYYKIIILDSLSKTILFNNLINFDLSETFIVPMGFIQLNNLIVSIYIVFIYIKFTKRISNYLSDDNLNTKKYVQFFIFTYITLIIVYSLFVLLVPTAFIQYVVIPSTVYFFFFVTFVVYSKIPIHEQKQNIILSNIHEEINNKEIPHDLSKELKTNLINIIIQKELFKIPKLTLYDLAKELSLNSKELSVFINHNLKTNFSTFINEFRVKEAKKLLDENKHENLTLEAIAEMAGFNNRITFYRAFKKIEHISPSDYISQLTDN
jgi:AraC-like DNA-binding protein